MFWTSFKPGVRRGHIPQSADDVLSSPIGQPIIFDCGADTIRVGFGPTNIDDGHPHNKVDFSNARYDLDSSCHFEDSRRNIHELDLRERLCFNSFFRFPAVVTPQRANVLDAYQETVLTKLLGFGSYGNLCSLVGSPAIRQRTTLSTAPLMSTLGGRDWDHFEKILYHTFYKLLACTPEDSQIVSTTSPGSLPSDLVEREKAEQILFETFNIPVLAMPSTAVSSLLASGRTTGVVVDLGAENSFVTCVVDGRELSSVALGYGGYAVTEKMVQMLIELNDPDLEGRGEFLKHVSEVEAIRNLKETQGWVSRSRLFSGNEATPLSRREQSLRLPDGSFLRLDLGRCLCEGPEEFFAPSDSVLSPIHVAAVKKIRECDEIVQSQLLHGIVLTGGSSLFPGLRGRLQTEIESYGRCSTRVLGATSLENISVQQHLAWFGASLIPLLYPASLHDSVGSWRSPCWVSQEQYDDIGPIAIHDRMFAPTKADASRAATLFLPLSDEDEEIGLRIEFGFELNFLCSRRICLFIRFRFCENTIFASRSFQS